MALQDVLSDLRRDPMFMANVMAWQTVAAQNARLEPIPERLHPTLRQALRRRDIDHLYSHQAEAVDLAMDGANVAVVTPTASGKTLCYNLPVLHSLLGDPNARALYLFPTKALAQDQLAELNAWRTQIDEQRSQTDDLRGAMTDRQPDLRSSFFDLSLATYDGDTPSAQRVGIRRNARIILSNPDMLHVGVMPYHPNWAEFLGGLRFVVIDEMHVYRGVFGSHMANVLRRLRRICALYGSNPQFICTSATIANPDQLAEKLIERPVTVVDRNGAPSGDKHIVLYNPPITDQERGLRRSSTLETQDLATRFILGGIQTIVFGRSRLVTEVLLSYLQERIGGREAGGGEQTTSQRSSDPRSAFYDSRYSIRGYRGGYLPSERRAIEAGLRSGEVQAVVATNALELGIDIGQLQAAVLCGYPGSIASTWQQMGRAGRTAEAALAILVATGGLLDQYIIQNPGFLFENSPEHAFINPDNLMLLVDQLRCAAFELPFQPGETFGACTYTDDVLQLLAEQGELHAASGRYFWSGEGYPAQQVSLRSAGSDSVTIQAERSGGETVIGEIDHASATMLVHEGAIYIHEGQSYVVTSLDLDEKLARVAPTRVDYYTEVTAETKIEILCEQERRADEHVQIAHGELLVSSRPVGYRRIKRFTHETLGVYPLEYEPAEVETNGYWFGILPAAQMKLAMAGHWYDSENNYGPNWQEQRQRVRIRDNYECVQCGAPELADREHDVHHLIPFRTSGYVAGLNENYKLANRLDNLILVCRNCHRRLESAVRTRTGLDGVAYALANLAPLHLMCDRTDLGVSVDRGAAIRENQTAAFTGSPNPQSPIPNPNSPLPTVTLYERIAAGLGFSARLYEIHDELLVAARSLIAGCSCQRGCPACVGPVLDDETTQLETKQLALALLAVMTAA